jgi:hypothetical protein
MARGGNPEANHVARHFADRQLFQARDVAAGIGHDRRKGSWVGYSKV